MPENGSPSSESYFTGARPRFLFDSKGALMDGALSEKLAKTQKSTVDKKRT